MSLSEAGRASQRAESVSDREGEVERVRRRGRGRESEVERARRRRRGRV